MLCSKSEYLPKVIQSKAATHAQADTIILSNDALTHLAVHGFTHRNWSCIVHNHHMELKTWSDLCGMLPESAAFSAQKLIPLTTRIMLQTKHAEKRAWWRLHNSWKCDQNTNTLQKLIRLDLSHRRGWQSAMTAQMLSMHPCSVCLHIKSIPTLHASQCSRLKYNILTSQAWNTGAFSR